MRDALHAMFIVAVVMTCSAFASGEPITKEDLVKKSELIVLGKLSDRKELDKDWATATLTIKETWKGDAKLKTVTVKFLAKPGNTASWTYQGNEEGVWFLRKEGELYVTFHPNCLVRTTFTDVESKKQVQEFLDAIRKIIAVEKAKP